MLSIEYLEEVEDVYDITVEDNHNFFANGILVHNCQEVVLPTKPITNIMAPPEELDGEIALCTLAAFNLGALESNSDLEELAYIIVEALDELLDYQDYPVNAAKHALKRRSLGVGSINYAYWLAKNGFKYSDSSGNNATHALFEAIQFYLMKASMELAKEKGACEWFSETKYSKGIMPVDLYKKDVDFLHYQENLLDWDWLRSQVLEHGMRNSTLSCILPSETSSVISNATNGIEPPRGPVSIKAGKDGSMKLIVPEYKRLKDNYEFLWDIPDNLGYIEKVAIIQKFVDLAISANTNYDPAKFPENKVPMKVLFRDIFLAYKYGFKTLYYHNTRDGRGVDNPEAEIIVEEDDGCASGACKI
jgi:ribonucleoside-diphosphate reductase alpha chain